tara:strand:+ start:543 stop:779 length:237 start_codon:yes stop_codon:yes gene_type:complete
VFAASMSAVVPLPLGGGEALAPCDIYKTDVYGGGCITLYYFWVLVFAVVMVALMGLDMREQVLCSGRGGRVALAAYSG